MIRSFFKKYGWRYIPGLVLMIACSWIQTRAPIALGLAVDAAANAKRAEFIHNAASIFIIALGVFVTRFGWRWFIVRTSREMEVYLRDGLYTHLINLPVGYYSTARSGDLMAYAVNDVNAVRMMFGMVLCQAINSVSSLIFSIARMGGHIDLKLTVYSLLPVPAAIFTVLALGTLVRRRAKRAQEMFSVISGHVQENINGMRVIKAFAQEKPQYAEYEKESQEKRSANLKWYFAAAYMDPIIKSVFAVSYAMGLIYGGQLVINGTLQLSDYIAFNSYLTMIVNPIVVIGRINNNLQRGLASYKRLKTLLDEPEVSEFDRLGEDVPFSPSVSARDLRFQYPSAGAPALDGVSFELAEGRMLGIVGPTGGGKTTILSLLLKLYVPERGQLFLGERDICDIPAACLRKRVGYVPQDGFLFDESILENVRFFSQASDDEILRCLDIACMAQDISRMPEGVKTLCGE
ncbi:MAG: ABC transporter ATP-binding protein, partial [Clostridia bacterium]|nr:ABC transporter ATP-binding protein [Clostridia bacterium]